MVELFPAIFSRMREVDNKGKQRKRQLSIVIGKR